MKPWRGSTGRNANPIGQRIQLDDGDPHSGEPYRTIVGVAADVRELSLQQEAGDATYVPLPQVTDSTLALSLRIVPISWGIRTKATPFSLFPAVENAISGAAGLPVL